MMKHLGWDKKEFGSSEWMVLEAAERANVLDKGHLIAVDNYYASPKLFAHLAKRGTDMVGTVRSNRRGWPKAMVALPAPKSRWVRGDHRQAKAVIAGTNESLYALNFFDKREVRLLSTFPAPMGTANRRVKATTNTPFHTIRIPMGGQV
jgi:hypothetical protein